MVIKILLVNSSNSYRSKRVLLPCIPAVLESALNEIDAKTSQSYVVLNIDCKIEGLCSCVNNTTSLGELNEAAFLIQQLPKNKHNDIQAFINDKTPTMTDLLIYLQSLFS